MPHNAAFHQGLHCLLRPKQSSEIQFLKDIIICDPSIYTSLFVWSDSLHPSQQFFQLCRDRFSWVEPVLSKDQCVLLKNTMQWCRWCQYIQWTIPSLLFQTWRIHGCIKGKREQYWYCLTYLSYLPTASFLLRLTLLDIHSWNSKKLQSENS